jgi:prepilin-type N-terminal cleavage/methylation domain-containing protein
MIPRRSRTERSRRRRSGFTLIEALVAMSLVVISGSALLLGVSSAMQSADESLDRTIAQGMAEQLMDEIAGNLYASSESAATMAPNFFGPNAAEQAGEGRERYNDIDDFHDFTARPPEDLWGVALGADDGQGELRNANFRAPEAFFQNWRQTVRVYYVDPSDPSVEVETAPWPACRAVEVTIYYDDPTRGSRILSQIRRVFANVPRS